MINIQCNYKKLKKNVKIKFSDVPINITGSILAGFKYWSILKDGKITPVWLSPEQLSLSVIDNNSPVIMGFNSAPYGSIDEKQLINIGSNKTFIPDTTDDDLGFYVFTSLFKPGTSLDTNHILKYLDFIKEYEQKNMYPEVKYWCIANFDCLLHSTNFKPINKPIRLKGTAFALVIQRIHYPIAKLDLSDPHSLDIINDMLIRVPKRKYFFDLSTYSMDSIFGEKFSEKNPKHSRQEYDLFLKKVIELASHSSICSQPYFGRIFKPRMGNVLYCKKAKKWYMIDPD